MALRGEPEGLAVMVIHQTRGKGRLGRSWVSPAGKNLALSLILRPPLSPRDAALLGMLASVAVAETVEEKGVPRAELKWPNDVLVKGRKIAGILPEARTTGASIDFVIIGIGLNVNSQQYDFPPDLSDSVTSLLLCTAKEHGLEDVAHCLLRGMKKLYDRVWTEGSRFIVPLWESRWAHRGVRLVRDGVSGVAEEVDQDGALILKMENGRRLRFHSGEAEPVDPAGVAGTRS
jgi:BirA family biotin operon repressor/biotin-[acetyl-CoA-carboxylase] ligase